MPQSQRRGTVTGAPIHLPTAGRVILQPQQAGLVNGRREYQCVFMQPGRVRQVDQEPSHWHIPAETIARDAHKFDGVASYLDHAPWFSDPSVRDLVGVTFNVGWADSEQALLGSIRLYEPTPGSAAEFVTALIDQILEDQMAGREVPPVGLSATFYHTAEYDEETGTLTTTSFRHVESIDFVYSAGAGGYVRAALAAIGRPEGGVGRSWPIQFTQGAEPPAFGRSSNMPEERVSYDVGGSESDSAPPETSTTDTVTISPPPLEEAQHSEALEMAEALAAIRRVADRVESLTGQVDRLTAFVADQEADHTVSGMGLAPRDQMSLRMGRTGLEQIEQALDALLAGTRPPDGIQPLTGVRELYLLLSGDYEMTGRFNQDRVYLANVNSSTMAALVANRLNKVVVNTFMQYPQWWGPIVAEMDFSTLQDARWITLGGIGELPTVTEGAAYTELTWDDNTETATFVKKGGYLGITIEAIDKDDTRRLRMAPQALAQAAWLTLGKSVSSIFTSASGVGPDLADATALFDATRSNLGSTALSHSAWVATRTAMRKQTELNSSERLGALTAPKFILVPPDLEVTALQVLATEHVPGSGNWNENPFAQGNVHDARLEAAQRRVIVIDLWTDTDNWAAVADPNLYPCLGIGYRYGRTPEIFSVASPTAGLMFSNDVMPVKVRFFYATGPIDYRGLYKHNV